MHVANLSDVMEADRSTLSYSAQLLVITAAITRGDSELQHHVKRGLVLCVRICDLSAHQPLSLFLLGFLHISECSKHTLNLGGLLMAFGAEIQKSYQHLFQTSIGLFYTGYIQLRHQAVLHEAQEKGISAQGLQKDFTESYKMVNNKKLGYLRNSHTQREPISWSTASRTLTFSMIHTYNLEGKGFRFLSLMSSRRFSSARAIYRPQYDVSLFPQIPESH